jgi:type IV pilus assembly protein PilC
MGRYTYVARDMNGAIYKGIIQAVDANEVRHRLRQRGFYPTSVKSMRELRLRTVKRIKRKDVAVFAEQLATMVDSGLTLVRCMDTVMKQTRNQRMGQVIQQVKQDIENGVPFSEALKKHPKIFPPLFVSMVLAGETGGTLAKSLRQLADYLDREQETRQKVKSALTYPKIVALASVLVVFVLVVFIVPRFAQIYDELGVSLPFITIALVTVSKTVARFWWAILAAGVLIYFGYKQFGRSKFGREIVDKVKLRAPVFGDLNRKVVVSRFIRIMSTLIPNGVPMMQSLDVAQEVADNRVMDQIIDGIRTSINSGGSLTEPIAASEIFPIMVVQMVSVGEETGRLGELLEKSSTYLEREIDATIKSLIARIEPSMTVILAALVAFIALSIYLPLFNVFSALKNV